MHNLDIVGHVHIRTAARSHQCLLWGKVRCRAQHTHPWCHGCAAGRALHAPTCRAQSDCTRSNTAHTHSASVPYCGPKLGQPIGYQLQTIVVQALGERLIADPVDRRGIHVHTGTRFKLPRSPVRCVGQQQCADKQHDARHAGQCKAQAPTPGVDVLGAVVDELRSKNTCRVAVWAPTVSSLTRSVTLQSLLCNDLLLRTRQSDFGSSRSPKPAVLL